jgi:chromosome segregation ATPase
MIGFYFGAQPGAATSSDPAERARLKAELDGLLVREPTVRSLEEAVEQKLKTVAEAKRSDVTEIKDELAEIKKKIDEGSRAAGDLSLSIDKVRATQAEATAAVAKLAPLKQRLESIT